MLAFVILVQHHNVGHDLYTHLVIDIALMFQNNVYPASTIRCKGYVDRVREKLHKRRCCVVVLHRFQGVEIDKAKVLWAQVLRNKTSRHPDATECVV